MVARNCVKAPPPPFCVTLYSVLCTHNRDDADKNKFLDEKNNFYLQTKLISGRPQCKLSSFVKAYFTLQKGEGGVGEGGSAFHVGIALSQIWTRTTVQPVSLNCPRGVAAMYERTLN